MYDILQKCKFTVMQEERKMKCIKLIGISIIVLGYTRKSHEITIYKEKP